MNGADLNAAIAAQAALVGLVIPPECMDGVRAFLALAAGHAATLDTVENDPDDLALAAVYRLPDPG